MKELIKMFTTDENGQSYKASEFVIASVCLYGFITLCAVCNCLIG